ncbi:MAG: hypothetical protein WDN45_16910 [Caulobacteraceae bacterium]
MPLITSFRSTPEVLGFVDAGVRRSGPVARGCRRPAARRCCATWPAAGGDSGCVDLWPWSAKSRARSAAPGTSRWTWKGRAAPTAAWPRRIAEEIKALVARGDAVHGAGRLARRPLWRRADPGAPAPRPVRGDPAGRSNGGGVPVAGADRLSLSAHIAFDD